MRERSEEEESGRPLATSVASRVRLLLDAARSCPSLMGLRAREVVWLWSAAWIIVYLMCTLAVGVSVLWPEAAWLCKVAFLTSLGSVVFHIVRASLTRFLPPVRLIVGLNVVVLAAALLVRDRLSKQSRPRTYRFKCETPALLQRWAGALSAMVATTPSAHRLQQMPTPAT